MLGVGILLIYIFITSMINPSCRYNLGPFITFPMQSPTSHTSILSYPYHLVIINREDIAHPRCISWSAHVLPTNEFDNSFTSPRHLAFFHYVRITWVHTTVLLTFHDIQHLKTHKDRLCPKNLRTMP